MPLLAPIWLPFGLLDRQQLAPPRVSATTEIDGGPSVSSTLHAQMSTECDCHIGAYGTLPLAFSLPRDPGVAAAGAGGPIPSDESQVAIGTAEVGVFAGSQQGGYGHAQEIYRLGVLLPSASREQPRFLASARVGDEVLELPRTMGVRLSHSQIWIKDAPWTSIAQHILLAIQAQVTPEEAELVINAVMVSPPEQQEAVSVEEAGMPLRASPVRRGCASARSRRSGGVKTST